MKRVALLCLGLALGAANAAEAQLTMQMSNGWTLHFRRQRERVPRRTRKWTMTAPPSLPAASSSGTGANTATRIRTGLLPAFAVFDAKGKEGETDLGVHFGFAPQIQCGPGNA